MQNVPNRRRTDPKYRKPPGKIHIEAFAKACNAFLEGRGIATKEGWREPHRLMPQPDTGESEHASAALKSNEI